MKLRNFLIVLFAVLMVFAFASCKNEPADPKPQPKPQPQIPDYYQIVVTEGVDKDYWNRDKIKIEWEEEVNAGDTISLKYRSERDVYQWDIRDKDLKWVYETKKGSFTDPVLGEDGWWTLTYTFAKDINGAAVDSNERFGVYFRGNYVSTDLFEIKDIYLNDEPLEITQDNIKSYAELAEEPVEHDWTVKNWSVLFATGTVGEVDKTPLAEKVVDGGLVTGAPVNKEGYTLSIFTDAARTIPFDPTQPIKEAKIFYYSYVGIPRTVIFNTMGGSPIENEIVANGDMLVAEAEPTFEGKAFKAWYKDEGLTEAWVMTDPVLGDMTLYAAYGDPATVTFQANNGEEPATKIVAIGNPVKMPETPINGSKMFLGWYSDAECTVAYDFSAPVTANITVYGAWVNATDVTVNLNYEGAPAATTFKTALDVALAADDENLKFDDDNIGFVFDGWYTDAACETAFDHTAAVTGPVTLYAKWVQAPLYKIVATGNGADDQYGKDKLAIVHSPKDINDGDVLSFRYRTTRDFRFFSVRRAGGGKKWIYQNSNAAANYGFTSYETKEDGWTYVTYKFNKATAVDSADIPAENADFEIHFGNRWNDPSGNPGIVKGDILEVQDFAINGVPQVIAAADVTGYAGASVVVVEGGAYEWTDPTVTFVTGEGSAIAPIVVEFNGKLELPEDPVLAGSAFAGWFTDAEFATPFDADTLLIKDLTLYAKFTDSVTVSFDGVELDDIVIAKGNTIAKPADPAKAENVFGGWYADSEYSAEFDFTAAINADTTIYVKWVPSWTVTLNYNYGETPATKAVYVGKGEVMAAPASVARVGFFFGGWYNDQACTEAHDWTAAVTANTTVFAKWNAPAQSYKYTLSDPLDDYSHTTAERIQFRWKSSSVAMLADVKAGDTITLMLKASGGLSRVRFRAIKKNYDINATILDSVDGWTPVTLTFSEDYSTTDGFTIMVYESADAKVGDVLEIKALAFNGTSIPIADSSSTGLYPSADADGCYGPKAAMETIDL